MAGEGGERLYWMHFEAEKDGAHVVPAPVLVDSVANIQRVVYLLAKFTRGEELGQRAAFSSELPLIEHRRGWVELTGDVLYDADGRALSVTHARDFVPFGQDSIELRNVNLYNVPYRASPPLRFKVKYDPLDRLYDLDGEFGISVSASSRPDLHHELQEALSMLWIEYGEESPDRLSPKARRLRTDLRKRLTAA